MLIIDFLVAASLAFASDGFVKLPITREFTDSPSIKEIGSDDFYPELLTRGKYAYFAHFWLGGQKQIGTLDTGSADLWVYGDESGAPFPYTPGETATMLENEFKVHYLDGTSAKGKYYIDTLTWGGASLDLQFGLNNGPGGAQKCGVFGIGDKSRTLQSGGGGYDNFPARLKASGLTQSSSYSLDLGPALAARGHIVFGAIDTNRFTGKLKHFNVAVSKGFIVPFKVLGLYTMANIDSGSFFSYLDVPTVTEIAESYGAIWDPKLRAYKAPDSTVPEGDLIFDFYGVEVRVPPSDLWLKYTYNDTFDLCLTILPNSQSEGHSLLGDCFLRSAYVFHDLDNQSVAIGQANPDLGPSNYQVITTDGIPDSYLDLSGLNVC